MNMKTHRETVAAFLWFFATAVALGQAPAQQQQLGGPAGARREATVTAIPGVVAAGAKWSLVWQGTDNADGIVGTDDGGLLFAQEQPNRVSKLDQNDTVSVFVQNTRGTALSRRKERAPIPGAANHARSRRQSA